MTTMPSPPKKLPARNAANLRSNRIPPVDAYIAASGDFAQPILHHLREIIHEAVPEVTEEMKWSRPFFVCRGVILCNIAAFKQHCSFGLWGPAAASHMRADGVAASEGMGSFGKLTSVADLPSRARLVSYLRAAAQAVSTGDRTTLWPRPRTVKSRELTVPDALTTALAKNRTAAERFEAMSPSCRREYCDWIAEARRDETRDRRVATAIEWIAEGKSRNWKYEKT
jgi:uncharacterized protein YdeI (YjbR/CyaY-like superfamily)